jgi:hypothetical protein
MLNPKIRRTIESLMIPSIRFDSIAGVIICAWQATHKVDTSNIPDSFAHHPLMTRTIGQVVLTRLLKIT